MFTNMQDWSDIRRKVLVEGVSKRQICREYHIAHKTLAKILAYSEPPGYRSSVPRPRPKLDPYLGVITTILENDKDTHRKQRHTAKRIFERLRDEYGYPGGYTQVKDELARRRHHDQAVHMPIHHEPGEAQFDFGEAQVFINGQLCKAHYAVMALPASDAYFVKAYPRENTETFQDAHVCAFEHFGGVPTRTSYDNTSIAVAKIVGRARNLTKGFLVLQSHHLFAEHFCNPASGNEKGNVEGGVGYSRRNWMVPIPRFESWEAFNAYLARRCREDLGRVLRGHSKTKAERLVADQAAMLPLPTIRFEARRVAKTRATSLSLVRFDSNDYSVPTAFAHHECTVAGGISEVTISCGTQVVATHERSWNKQGVFYDPRHYLALLERKPGALDFARPLKDWDLPGCFDLLRRRLEADLGFGGTREFIKVLRLLEHASVAKLAGAIDYALQIGATSSDAITCILHHRATRPVSLFSLDGHPHLKPYAIETPDLSAYAQLKGA